jgi:hypothetical protein
VRKLFGGGLTLLLGTLALAACQDGGSMAPENLDITPSFAVAPIGNGGSVILYAGQNIPVGHVEVSNTATNLKVKYIVDAPWKICETHLAVAADLSGIPQSSGGPVPGQFPYKGEYDPCTSGPIEYNIPHAYTAGTLLYIAAHAVVQGAETCEEPADVIAGFPTEAHVCVKGPRNDTGVFFGEFYFSEVAVTLGGVLDGTYGGWCTDLERSTPLNPPDYTCFDAWVLPATPAFTFPFLDHPENLDLANWLLNQDLVGTDLGNGSLVTYGDVQRAIWVLLEGRNPSDDFATSPWLLANINEIVGMANAQGEGFVPDCGDYIGVLLDPKETEQPLMIPKLIECECTPGGDETAWGFGDRFLGRGNWATYIKYTVG